MTDINNYDWDIRIEIERLEAKVDYLCGLAICPYVLERKISYLFDRIEILHDKGSRLARIQLLQDTASVMSMTDVRREGLWATHQALIEDYKNLYEK